MTIIVFMCYMIFDYYLHAEVVFCNLPREYGCVLLCLSPFSILSTNYVITISSHLRICDL
uniref:Uncharacterized protein n=1 Tax=Arundo donax TaxID=35708 RepID=A0A0A8YZK7_ARUDO